MRAVVAIVLLGACRMGFDDVVEQDEPAHVSSESVYDEPDSFESILVWYALDDIANKAIVDVSGNERHGVCRNGVCPKLIAGEIDDAADFTSSVVDVPAIDITGAFTITAWIGRGSSGCLLKTRTAAPWSLCFTAGDIAFLSGTHMLPVTITQATDWFHVAIRWDGTSKQIYVGGKQVASAEANGTTFPRLVMLGSFSGRVDDVRVYDRALTPTQIAAMKERLY